MTHVIAAVSAPALSAAPLRSPLADGTMAAPAGAAADDTLDATDT